MDRSNDYIISFSGLKNGKHNFEFEVDDSFFQTYGIEQEFSKTQVTVNALLEKHSTFMELELYFDGKVELICDVENEPFDYNLNNHFRVLVKFGTDFDDSHEEILVLPAHSHELNISQLIYDGVILALPMKKLCPAAQIEWEQDEENLLEFSNEISDESNEIDPRWAALQNLMEKLPPENEKQD